MSDEQKDKWVKRSRLAAIFSLVAHIFLIILLFQLIALYADPQSAPIGYSFNFSYDFKVIFLFMVLIFIGLFLRKSLSILWLKIFTLANLTVAISLIWQSVTLALDAGIFS